MPRTRHNNRSGNSRRSARRSSAKTARPKITKAALASAFMDLIKEKGWRGATLPALAEKEGIALQTLQALAPTRTALLQEFLAMIDAETFAAPADGNDVREKLFDLLMRRYETLAPYRPALKRLIKDGLADPSFLKFVGAILPLKVPQTLGKLLQAAGSQTRPPRHLLEKSGLLLVVAWAGQAFLRDETPDLAKTMAALDRSLRLAEHAAQLALTARPESR